MKLELTYRSDLIVAVSTLFLFSCNPAKNKTTPEARLLAEAYGIENFDKINSIDFTFNVLRDSVTTSRSWHWEPKTNEVSYSGPDDTISYNRERLDSPDIIEADKKFINDTYWLLFPFQLVWSEYSLEVDSNVNAPMSSVPATCLTVSYNQEGGYTPGDMYELYVGQDGLIKEWAYHKGGVDTPSMIATWENVQSYKGIKISTDHRFQDGNTRLFFTGITVE